LIVLIIVVVVISAGVFVPTIIASVSVLLLLESSILTVTVVPPAFLWSWCRGLDIQILVTLVKIGRLAAVHRIDESACERRLIKQGVVWAQKVISVPDRTMVINLLAQAAGKE
jgi:hypothetical protein